MTGFFWIAVTRIVEIDHGKFYSYPGSYSRFVELKAERQNMEIATERKRQSILRTELQWLMRGGQSPFHQAESPYPAH